MKEQTVLLFLLNFLALYILADGAGVPKVFRIEPHQGTAGGGMKARIIGENFANDSYVIPGSDATKGNEVTFTDGESQIPCEVFIEDTTSEYIVCWTHSGMVVGRTYYVRVKVDGEEVTDENLCNNDKNGYDCSFTASWYFTPLVRNIQPQTGMPGEDLLITLSGRTVTDRLGSDQYCAENGRCEKILRVWGPGLCLLRKPDNTFYGTEISETSLEGSMTCHPNETFVGNANFSILYEQPFGRSIAQTDQLRVSAMDQLYMFQYYTDANVISGSQVSEAGGATLRIAGSFYELGGTDDSTYDRMWVRTGVPGTECTVTHVERDEYVDCVIDKKPDVMPTDFPGGRGVNWEYWSASPFSSLSELKDAPASATSKHLDETQLCGDEINAYQTRMTGIVIPPKTGEYQFQLKSDYQAQIYVNDVLHATSTGTWQGGPRMELTQNEHYLVTVVAMGSSSNPDVSWEDACIEARLIYFSDEKFTSAWTGNALDDEQILRFTSTPTQDVQVLSFSSHTTASTPVAEVQEVCVEGGSYEIRLGLFDTWTEFFGLDVESDIVTVLNKMAILNTGQTFTATKNSDTCAQITFPLGGGDYPPFEVQGKALDSFTVTELTKGVPDNNKVSLSIGGRPSVPFGVSGLNQTTLQAAVDSLFETKCPGQFNQDASLFQSFEGPASDYAYTVTNEVEAFCGKQSIETPRKIYPWHADQGVLRMTGDFHICFAYSGLQWNATFKFKYNPPLSDEERWSTLTLDPLQKQTELNPWSYACVHPYPIMGKGNLIEARLEGDYIEKFYVDALYIGPSPTFTEAGDLSSLRLRPASPNSDQQVLIDHAEVTHDVAANEFTVRLFPLFCGYNFGLFELINKQGDSPSGDVGSTTLSGGSTTLSVSRTETASSSVRVNFRVSWQGTNSGAIQVDLANMTDAVGNITKSLQAIKDIGMLDVKMSDGSTCDNADAHVIFRTRAGDQELMQIVSSQVQSPPSGNLEIVNHRDGHLRYDPIPGDLIFERHNKPQAIPYLNNIPAYCSGDCSFEWSVDATPSVSGLSANEGFPGDEIIITGTGFSLTLEDNVVTIGGEPCVTTDASDTQITCTVGPGSGIDQPVVVNVAGKGIASGDVRFTYDKEISGFEPLSGSYGGGQKLTISGNGLPEMAEVFIGNKLCDRLSWSPTQIKCLTPEFEADLLSDSMVTVELREPARRKKRQTTQTASGQYTLSVTDTVQIDSFIVPETFSVKGGDTIQAVSPDFNNNTAVIVGGISVDYETSDSGGSVMFTFQTPVLPPDEEVAVCINVDEKGCAVIASSNVVPKIMATLSVTGFEPTHGSLHGGTVLTINGEGFSTVMEDVQVTVGGYTCNMRELSDIRIICQIGKMCNTVEVTNNGTGNGFDQYYAFDTPIVVVTQCDTIRFKWTTWEAVENTNHGVYQVESETSEVKVPYGVDSGPQRREGIYEYTFNKPTAAGQPIHIWSGRVNDAGRSYRGQIIVNPKEDAKLNKVVVSLGGQEAIYKPAALRRKRQTVPACTAVTTAIDGCSVSDPVILDSQNAYFITSKCYMPRITALSHVAARPEAGYERTVTTVSDISVSGSGFGTEPCALEVTLGEGDSSCYGVVLSDPAPTVSGFVFQPNYDCTLPSVGMKKEMMLYVANLGFAFINLEQYYRQYILLPSMQSLTPNSGSQAGFTPVTIGGTGLKDVDWVRFNDFECWDLEVIDDAQIRCVSPKTTRALVTLGVGNSYPGKCDISTSEACYFSYVLEKTPKVDTVSPTSINSTDPTTVTLTGEMFGNVVEDVTVEIGGEECSVSSLPDANTIECTLNGCPAGKKNIDVYIAGLGKASTTKRITCTEVLDSVMQVTGSIHGGTILTITGHGFHREGTSVTVGGNACEIQGEVTLSQVVCEMPPHAAGLVEVQVAVIDIEVNFPALEFTYTDELVASVDPTSGAAGDIVTITGSGFGADFSALSVNFDESPCEVQEAAFSYTSFQCVLGSHTQGEAAGFVLKQGYGRSNPMTMTYVPRLDSIAPYSGYVDGNQYLTLLGSGFSPDMEVTVCSNPCPLDTQEDQTSSELVCITPPGIVDQVCDVSILSTDLTLSGAYTYVADGGPTVDGINPSRVGTGGGTIINLTGAGFGVDPAAVSVLIEGNVCEINSDTLSDTNIECTVPPKTWLEDRVQVVVRISSGGVRRKRNAGTTYLRATGNLDLWYIDQWSSKWTWGGEDPPGQGMLVEIPAGQSILLDEDTEVLSMLLINGGNFIFDCSKDSVELHAEYILITGGGRLEIGTEEHPCLNKATITMYGNHRSKVLPVYGSKVVAIRNGTFEAHGMPISHTWTKLSATAEAGASSIFLPTEHVGDWRVGDEIVIATTGNRESQIENERHTIADKVDSGDGVTTELVLESPLEYGHFGVTETYTDERGVEWTGDYRAEVGLLTRTVVVRGGPDPPGWNVTIEKCPDGFNSGQHAVQTCFQGRYGEETGSMKFGAHIMAHSPVMDSNSARMVIQYIEVYDAGQAYQLGRYPFHSHVNGDMSQSKLIGNSVHDSNNRAFNIHHTSNLLVENNVVFNINGGTFFTEDGIETGNEILHNLCVFTKGTDTLQNDDLNAACYWVTNANNTYIGNAAAGCSHMCYWFRFNEFPDGPSYTPDIHPRNVPLGIFRDNTCHSCGEIGLWIFQIWEPQTDASPPASISKVQPAVHENFHVWGCRKGVETVDVGSIVFDGLFSAMNAESDVEGIKQMNTPKDEVNGAMVRNSFLAGHTDDPSLKLYSTPRCITAPFGAGYSVQNVTCYNFDDGSSLFHWAVKGLCPDKCGGFYLPFSGFSLQNSDTAGKVFFRWSFEALLEDKDGIWGVPGSIITPWNPTLPPECVKDASLQATGGQEVAVCPPDIKHKRFAFKDVLPASMSGQDFTVVTQWGYQDSTFQKKRFTHKPGWMVTLLNGETTKVGFKENGVGEEPVFQAVSNYSFSGMISDLTTADDGVILCFSALQRPDRVVFNTDEFEGVAGETLDFATASHGDWVYSNGEVCVAIKGPSNSPGEHPDDFVFHFSFYKCHYTNCEPPLPALQKAPETERPAWAKFWGNDKVWIQDSVNNTVRSAGPDTEGETGIFPVDYNDVIVEKDDWVVLNRNSLSPVAKRRKRNTATIYYGTLMLLGTLEISDKEENGDPAVDVYDIHADFIIIKGRLIIGWEDNPFLAPLSITLHGTKDSPSYENSDWSHPLVGAKAIANFGGLDLHGRPVNQTWTKLVVTASAGASTIEVKDDVSDWFDVVSGRDIEIVITPTSNRATDTEKAVIQSVAPSASGSGTTITLREPLLHTHISTSETVNGETYEFAAAVGLLTRNILVQGDIEESVPTYGPRILCSIMQDNIENDVYQCYLRATATEFRFMGQEGFTEESDPRSALAIVNADNLDTRPIYLTGNSFHDLYGVGLTVVGSADIEVQDNVIYHTIGTCLYDRSSGAVVRNNLLTDMIWPGTYIGRYEEHNFKWDACLDMFNAPDPVIEGNYVAGSQRVAYLLSGAQCDTDSPYSEATANWAVSSLRGINIFPTDTIEPKTDNCNLYSNMKFWKNEAAFYYQSSGDVIITKNVLADNKDGLFALLIGPSAEAHICEHKFVKIYDSVMFGYLTEDDCSEDSTETELDEEDFYRISGPSNIDCRGVTGPRGEWLSGIIFPSCDEGPNKAPRKPCFATQATNCICGSTEVKGVTFKNFGSHGSCEQSFAFSDNPSNDDQKLPVTVSESTMIDVTDPVYFARPNLRKVNAGDCVDIDCPGMLNLVFQDVDGSVFGSPGAAIPAAEFEWDTGSGGVDRRRGRGDYRIPAPALTDYITGLKMDASVLCDIRGRPRFLDDRCTTINKPQYSDSQGNYFFHQCTGITYKLMAFESLDWDAKSRRISPVFTIQELDGVKTCSFETEAQDHGCCAGYNCNKRQSLFHVPVVPATPGLTDGLVQIFLMSTNPDKMRFLFSAPDDDSCVVNALYYNHPYRIDIFIESEDGSTAAVTPKNARVENGKFFLDYIANEDVPSERPTCDDPMGTNFIHRDARIMYFVLKGRDKILAVRSVQIIVSFFMPMMTEAEFFEGNVLVNLAALLDVPPSMVRTVKIVSSADGTRKRRATVTDGIIAELEIGDPPAESADEVDNSDITQLGSVIMTGCQDNTISGSLAVEGTECEQVIMDEIEYVPVVPHSLQFVQELTPQYEGGEFVLQPKLQAYDSSGNIIQYLGIQEDPWQMTATIKSGTGHPDATLGGTKTVSYENGQFSFTDLYITHAGSGYVIEFDITKPYTAADLNLTISSQVFDIDVVPMKAALYAITSDDITEGDEFSITIELRNQLTNLPITDIGWRGHTFDVECGLPSYNDISTLNGNGSMTFDTSTGRAQFDGLSLSGYGPIYLECHVVSDPTEFDFYLYQKIFVLGTSQVGIPRETSEIIIVRFPNDYTALNDSQRAQLEQVVLQDIVKKNPDIIIIESTISAGSILITFTVEGASLNVSAMSEDLCTSIKEGQSYTIGSTTFTLDPYMTVDGKDYYGVNCGATTSSSEGLHPGYIALIAVVAAVILVIIIIILLWKFKVIPKTKTHEIANTRFAPETDNFPSSVSRRRKISMKEWSAVTRTTIRPRMSSKWVRSDSSIRWHSRAKLAKVLCPGDANPVARTTIRTRMSSKLDNGKTVFLGHGITHEGTFTSMSSTLYSSHINVDMRKSPTPVPPVNTEDPDKLRPPPGFGKATHLNVSPLPNHKHWKY